MTEIGALWGCSRKGAKTQRAWLRFLDRISPLGRISSRIDRIELLCFFFSQRRRVFGGMFLDRINRIDRIELLCFFSRKEGMATVFRQD